MKEQKIFKQKGRTNITDDRNTITLYDTRKP